MIITIGKSGDNDHVVDNPHVSRYHARLIAESTDSMVIEDLGSANGTFVNGVQVARKHIALSDTILLGLDHVLNLREVLREGNDFSLDFAKLKKVYDDYVAAKIKIQSSNQFKTRVLQSLPFALVGIAGLLIGFLGKGSKGVFFASLLIAIIAPTIGIFLGARQAAKTPAQLQALADRFKTDYVCPKCNTFLGEIPWESLVKKKACPVPSCKARWIKDDPEAKDS